jgi:DNA repair exonuclease SbcCD ATPase subunit
MELDKAEQELNEVESKMVQLQIGNGADLKRKELSEQINSLVVKRNVIYEAAVQHNLNDYKEKQKKVSDATLKFNEALNNQKLMQQTIEADQRLIERCKETIAECDKIREDLIAKWPREKFTYDPVSTPFCPTCGQHLPEEQFQAKIEQMRTDFNIAIEAAKKSINAQGHKNNETKAKAEEELKSYEEKLAADTEQLEIIKQEINTIFAEKANIEKLAIKTVDELLAESAEFNELSAQIEQLKEQLEDLEP